MTKRMREEWVETLHECINAGELNKSKKARFDPNFDVFGGGLKTI